MLRLKRNILILLAIATASLLIFFKSSKNSQTLLTTSVKIGNIEKNVLAVGQIIPEHVVEVKSQISGQVEKLYINNGDYVKQGQKLLTIKPNTTPAKIAQALSDVKQSEAMLIEENKIFNRKQSLFKQKLLSQQEFDTAKKDLALVKFKYELAKQNLDLLKHGQASIDNELMDNTLYSPIDGYILKRNINLGDSVVPVTDYQSGTPLFIIADMSRLIFKGEVSQLAVNSISNSMSAVVKIAALPELTLQGQVSYISLLSNQTSNENSQADSNTKPFSMPSIYTNGFAVEINHLHIPAGFTLRAGYLATASIKVQSVNNVPILLQKAIFYDNEDQAYVQLVEKSGKLQKKIITTGLSDETYVEITHGLKAGDKVAIIETSGDN